MKDPTIHPKVKKTRKKILPVAQVEADQIPKEEENEIKGIKEDETMIVKESVSEKENGLESVRSEDQEAHQGENPPQICVVV